MTTDIRLIAPYSIPKVRNATLQEADIYLRDKQRLGLDIETRRKFKLGTYKNEDIYRPGLDPYLSDVIMIQVGDINRVFVIDVRFYTKEEVWCVLRHYHYNEEKLVVGTNLRFEGKHLNHTYNLKLKKVWDIMIVDMILYNGIPMRFDLASMAERYLGVAKKKENLLFDEMYDSTNITLDPDLLEENEHLLTPFEIADNFEIDKSTRLQFLTIGDKPFDYGQVMYGADDILFPLYIMERQMMGRKISENDIYNPKLCIRLENSFTQVLADIELNGIQINPDSWLELDDKNNKLYKQRLDELNEYVTTVYPHWGFNDLFNPDKPVCMVQWASSKQTIKFFKELDSCPKEYSKQTKRIDYTVGAKAMTKLLPVKYKVAYAKGRWVDFERKPGGGFVVDTEKLILAYLNVKKLEQACTTFGKEWLKYIHPITGRVHSSYRQILNTGRISSTNPNCQNLPGGDWRKCFIVSPGEIMINNDYSAQESRILANNSEDPLFLDFFKKGDPRFGSDFHSFTATKVKAIMTGDKDAFVPPKELPDGSDNPEFTKDDDERRGNAKTVNFGFAYGKSAKGFAEDFGCTVEEAQELLDGYLDAFMGLKDYFEYAENFPVDNGYVLIDPVSGRRWFYHKFDEFKALYEEGMKVYRSAEYKAIPKDQRAEWKKQYKEQNPDFKYIWKQWSLIKGSLSRKGKNYPIQGLAGSQTKMALCMIRHRIIKDSLDMVIRNTIHDEILATCPIEKGDEYGKIVQYCMEQGGNYFCNHKIMRAGYKLKDHWTH